MLVSAPAGEVFQLDDNSAHLWVFFAHNRVFYCVQELPARLGHGPRLQVDVHFDELDDKIALLLRLRAKVLTDDLADMLTELFWPVYFAQKQGILGVVEELVFVVAYVLVYWRADLLSLKSVVEQRKDALEPVRVIYSDVEVVEALNEAS